MPLAQQTMFSTFFWEEEAIKTMSHHVALGWPGTCWAVQVQRSTCSCPLSAVTRPSNTFFWTRLKVSLHENFSYFQIYINVMPKTMFQLLKVEAVISAPLLFVVLWQLNPGCPTHCITEPHPQPLLLSVIHVNQHTTFGSNFYGAFLQKGSLKTYTYALKFAWLRQMVWEDNLAAVITPKSRWLMNKHFQF